MSTQRMYGPSAEATSPRREAELRDAIAPRMAVKR
jgi:hypothetical protein